MQRRRRRVLTAMAAALCVLLAAAGCGGLIQGDPSKLVLTSAQLPSGFHVLAQGTYTNADVAQAFGIAESQVGGGMGRETGYRVSFVRDVTAANIKQGPVRIDSVVSLYQGAVPARNALTFEIKANEQRIAGLKALSLGSVGQQSFSFAYTQTDTTDNLTLRFVNVYWRERNAIAAVSVAGVAGGFADSQAMQLARVEDGLLKKAP
jgi:hypothetical protein